MSPITPLPAGYQFFVESLQLRVLPHFRQSYISPRGTGRVEFNHAIEIHVYPKSFLPKDTMGAQLEFALKYDGINLEILSAIFANIPVTDLTQFVQSQVTSKYVRKIWFLYEFLLDKQLPIADLTMGNYVDLLPMDEYFTAPIVRFPRYRINNNLLGDAAFCPIVRKTKRLNNFIDANLSEKVTQIFQRYPSNVVDRANQFLYLKETKSSFAIEKEQPNLKRTTRFVQALHEIERIAELSKQILIGLQNIIVEERFADKDYRENQNYVGQTLSGYRQKIHYISPRPEDIPLLMKGFLELTNHMQHEKIDPVVTAATCAFAFVFLHPFEDGNGRLHRLLIHYLLARMEFAPHGVIFPVSAVMLAEASQYDACLEAFSKPLLNVIDYDLREDGTLTVNNNTINFYRYFDATPMAEYLYDVINKVIEFEFMHELEFILNYDSAKKAIQNIVDMPDNKIDLFIKSSLDNSGKLSKTKRDKFFTFLSNKEIVLLENIVKEKFSNIDVRPK